MNEDRRNILEMLAAGKITTEEAERLLAALENSASSDAARPRPKYLRVVVDADRNGEKAPSVNVRVPMQLLRAGVRLASFVPPHVQDRVDRALHERGIRVGLANLKGEQLEQLVEQLHDLSVDVDDGNKGAKVRVFCE